MTNLRSFRACIVLLAVASLFACGGGGDQSSTEVDQPTDPSPTPTLQEQEVTFANAGPLVLSVGDSVVNNASATGSGEISYESSNVSVATVDQSGLITAIGKGAATITATIAADTEYDAAQGSYQVTVKLRPQSLSLADTGPIEGLVGETFSNIATPSGEGEVSYHSSNESVATVDSTGEVSLVGAGAATIEVSVSAGATFEAASVSYQIKALQQQSLVFPQSGPLHVFVGDQLANPVTAMGAGSATYESSDESVATADELGYVTVLSAGSAEISASVAADEEYTAATASYRLYAVSREVPMTAWVGSAGTEVNFQPHSDGLEFYRTRDKSCDLDNYTSCEAGALSILNAEPVTDTALNLQERAYYSLRHGDSKVTAAMPTPLTERDSHEMVFHEGKIWLSAGKNGLDFLNDVWTSVDGESWSLVTANAAFSPREEHQMVSYAGHLWVIGGEDAEGNKLNDVWRSQDGEIWEQVTASAGFLPRDKHQIVVFNQKLWLVGGHGNGSQYFTDIWSSVNGLAWTEEANGAFSKRVGQEVVVHNGELWMTGGYSGISFYDDIWHSSDGVNWTDLRSSSLSRLISHQFVSHNGFMWLVGGAVNGGTPTAMVRYSSDGIIWSTAVMDEYFSARSNHQVVSAGDSLVLVGGREASGVVADVWVSKDGTEWSEQQPLPAFSPRKGHQMVSHNGKLWVIAGQEETWTKSDVWSSEDGVNWELVTNGAPFGNRLDHAAFSFADHLWVIGGSNHWDEPLTDIWSSPDGAYWERISENAPFGRAISLDLVVYDEKMWFVSDREVWSSTDGRGWVTVSRDDTLNRRGHATLVFKDKLWVIGGRAAGGQFLCDVLSSSGGENWNVESSCPFSARSQLKAAVLNGRMWVYGGETASGELLTDIYSSVDGVNWVKERDIAEFLPRKGHQLISDGQNLWMSAGESGTMQRDVWRSTDGVTWHRGYRKTMNFPTAEAPRVSGQ